jgi:cell division septal protein FtsQ
MKRVRDFHSQSWNNPFFEKERLSRRWRFLIAGTSALFAGTALAGLVYTPVLKIQKIEVSGAKALPKNQIIAAAENAISGYGPYFLPKDFFLAARPENIRQDLSSAFPSVRTFTVERDFKKLSIAIEEREPTIRLIAGDGRSYLLDQDGTGIREATAGEGDKLIAVSGTGINFVPNAKVLPDNWAQDVQNIHKYFATLVGIRDQSIQIDVLGGITNVITVEGWYAVLDPSADLTKQLKFLSSTVTAKFNPSERKNILYIDPRLGEKIFYKMK